MGLNPSEYLDQKSDINELLARIKIRLHTALVSLNSAMPPQALRASAKYALSILTKPCPSVSAHIGLPLIINGF